MMEVLQKAQASDFTTGTVTGYENCYNSTCDARRESTDHLCTGTLCTNVHIHRSVSGMQFHIYCIDVFTP